MKRRLNKYKRLVVLLILICISLILALLLITTLCAPSGTEQEIKSNRVTWVSSMKENNKGVMVEEKGANGKTIKVPVPKGYTVSKIPGETSVSEGFVIYEGNIDWNSILVESASNNATINSNIDNSNVNTNIDTSINAGMNTDVSNNTVVDINTNTNTDINSNSIDNITNNNEVTKDILDNVDDIENAEVDKYSKDAINESTDDMNNNTVDTEKIANIDNTNTVNNDIDVGNITEENKIDMDKDSTDNMSMANDVALDNKKEVQSSTVQEIPEEYLEDMPQGLNIESQINIFNLQKTVNQYVWVPVSNIDDIYGIDSEGKYMGKLYNFPLTEKESRSKNNWTLSNGIMSITKESGFREPQLISSMVSYDIDSQLPTYIYGQTRDELSTKEMEQSFYEMIKSIKKYGGFYIGRYETGGLSEIPVVRKMDIDLTNQNWYTMYKQCQKLQGSNDNVNTSMIWGSLWDATLEWFVSSKSTNFDGETVIYPLVSGDSTTLGNYHSSKFDYILYDATSPVETNHKTSNSNAVRDSDMKDYIPAGSADYTKLNNIYDMAGNVWEWSLEAGDINGRTCRGGSYGDDASQYSISSRTSYDSSKSYAKCGCRAILLIQ